MRNTRHNGQGFFAAQVARQTARAERPQRAHNGTTPHATRTRQFPGLAYAMGVKL